MATPTKVCIFAPVHVSTDVRVYQKEAKALASAGYSVVLLARSVEGMNEELSGEMLSVEGVPRYKNRLQRFLLQPLMLRKILRTKASIIHLHNPDTLPLGFLLKLLGKTVIYDTHEDFTQRILMREWIPARLRTYIAKAVGKLEAWAGRVFDASIATQPDVAKRLGSKCIVLENAPISRGELIERAYAYSHSIPRTVEFRAIYVGTIGRSRGLIQMVKAMEYVNQYVSARLWLVGPVHDQAGMEEAKARAGWKYVDYMGSVPQEQAFAYIIRADVGLITICDIGDHAKTSPNKIFEYQRFGIPFIASNFAAWREKVGHVGAGVFVDQEDALEIAQMITLMHDRPQLAKEMGRRGMAYTINEYNWEAESEKLVSLYQSLSQTKPSWVRGVAQ
ncbi:glycosyltransferase [Brevibacillus choshinensis]|uniref:Glycosyltransferase n=1 Tax=Brevibacillus choshinensis TaxID=54911 RepID=A0ABX7FK60_BRECH|nr:glycosyltransferase [Brevibacillus choshinensis]QRG66240.1 glycosyltransferase [Brevibacillus choshinensis]